jgi:hypothetical protein
VGLACAWDALCARFRVVAPDLIRLRFLRQAAGGIRTRSSTRPTSSRRSSTTRVCPRCTCSRTTTAIRVAQELLARALDRQRHGLRGLVLHSVRVLERRLVHRSAAPAADPETAREPARPALSRFLGRQPVPAQLRGGVRDPRTVPTRRSSTSSGRFLAHKRGHPARSIG